VAWITSDRSSAKAPLVLTKSKIERLFGHLSATQYAMASLLYRTGLRPLACQRLKSELLEAVFDIRPIQGLPGHSDVSTTTIYTHVLNRPGIVPVVSPMNTRSPRSTEKLRYHTSRVALYAALSSCQPSQVARALPPLKNGFIESKSHHSGIVSEIQQRTTRK